MLIQGVRKQPNHYWCFDHEHEIQVLLNQSRIQMSYHVSQFICHSGLQKNQPDCHKLLHLPYKVRKLLLSLLTYCSTITHDDAVTLGQPSYILHYQGLHLLHVNVSEFIVNSQA